MVTAAVPAVRAVVTPAIMGCALDKDSAKVPMFLMEFVKDESLLLALESPVGKSVIIVFNIRLNI